MARSEFRFFIPHRARYFEIDRQDVVYHGHYLTYFSVAITEFLREVGSDYGSGKSASGVDFHIVKALAEYKAPIRFDQEIAIFVRVSQIGRSSLTYSLEVHPASEEKLLASGEVVWVAADRVRQKSVPIPADLLEQIAGYQGDTLNPSRP